MAVVIILRQSKTFYVCCVTGSVQTSVGDLLLRAVGSMDTEKNEEI